MDRTPSIPYLGSPPKESVLFLVGHVPLPPALAHHSPLKTRFNRSDAASRRSIFPSDNYSVRYTAQALGITDISKVTAHRPFDGHLAKADRAADRIRQIIIKM